MIKRTTLDTVYAVVSGIAGAALVALALARLLGGSNGFQFATIVVPVIQGVLLVAAGVQIWSRSAGAVPLIWVNTGLLLVGVLGRGLIPLDILVWFLLLAYAVTYSKRARTTGSGAQSLG